MNLLRKLAVKDLKLNKKRTIVTVIGIMLSVALLTTVTSLFVSGKESVTNWIKQLWGNYHCAFANVQIDDVKKIRNNRKVESVNIVKHVGLVKINTAKRNISYAAIDALTEDSLKNLSINLIEGRLPNNENEILIPIESKTEAGLKYKVGDTISLNVGNLADSPPFSHLVNLREKVYKVVGIIKNPGFSFHTHIMGDAVEFITYTEESAVNGKVSIFVRVTKEEIGALEEKIRKAEEKILKAKMASSKDPEDPSNDPMKELYDLLEIDIDSYKIADIHDLLLSFENFSLENPIMVGLDVVLIILIAVILISSVFCIRNSFEISVVEKLKLYGILKSIGATRKQIKKSVYCEASILGIIGIPLGILLGFFATFTLIRLSNYYLKGITEEMGTGIPFHLSFSFSLIAVIASVMLGIIVIYWSSFRAAHKTSKISEINLIRNSSNININSKKIKSSKLVRMIFGIGGEIAHKNLKRNKRKYRISKLSIIVAISTFLVVYSFDSTLLKRSEIEMAAMGIDGYDLALHLPAISESNAQELDKYIKTTEFDNIENYTILRHQKLWDSTDNEFDIKYISQSKYNRGSGITIIAVGEKSYKDYIKTLGLNYDDIKDKAILMNYRVSVIQSDVENEMGKPELEEVYNIKKGEKIPIGRSHTKEVKDMSEDEFAKLELEVGQITDRHPFGYNRHDVYFVVSDEWFSKFFPNEKAVKILYKSNNVEKLKESIEKSLEGEAYKITDVSAREAKINGFITLINIFLYGFLIVIFLIGVTSIFNTITASMQLRRPEFAILRSVGMTNKEFRRMIRLETLFMCTKSLIFGFIIGITLSYIIHKLLVVGAYELPLKAILITIFTVFALVSAIMRYSMNKINKQNIIDTIRNENT